MFDFVGMMYLQPIFVSKINLLIKSWQDMLALHSIMQTKAVTSYTKLHNGGINYFPCFY